MTIVLMIVLGVALMWGFALLVGALQQAHWTGPLWRRRGGARGPGEISKPSRWVPRYAHRFDGVYHARRAWRRRAARPGRAPGQWEERPPETDRDARPNG